MIMVKNILYKANGDERYPDFKLYKMIARLVHNHTPEKQLDNVKFFKCIKSTKKQINRKGQQNILYIDKIEPQY